MSTFTEIMKNPILGIMVIVMSICFISLIFSEIIDWMDDRKIAKSEKNKKPELPAMGIIRKVENEMRVVELRHNGGDRYEIMTYSKITGNGHGNYRHGEHRAQQEFAFACSLSGIKA